MVRHWAVGLPRWPRWGRGSGVWGGTGGPAGAYHGCYKASACKTLLTAGGNRAAKRETGTARRGGNRSRPRSGPSTPQRPRRPTQDGGDACQRRAAPIPAATPPRPRRPTPAAPPPPPHPCRPNRAHDPWNAMAQAPRPRSARCRPRKLAPRSGALRVSGLRFASAAARRVGERGGRQAMCARVGGVVSERADGRGPRAQAAGRAIRAPGANRISSSRGAATGRGPAGGAPHRAGRSAIHLRMGEEWSCRARKHGPLLFALGRMLWSTQGACLAGATCTQKGGAGRRHKKSSVVRGAAVCCEWGCAPTDKGHKGADRRVRSAGLAGKEGRGRADNGRSGRASCVRCGGGGAFHAGRACRRTEPRGSPKTCRRRALSRGWARGGVAGAGVRIRGPAPGRRRQAGG
jgi:hypothetical protein